MRKVRIPLKQIAGGPQCAQPPSPQEPNLEIIQALLRRFLRPMLWGAFLLVLLFYVLGSILGK
jgi:hypothetical protein